jgi:hypothetical protein
MFSNKVKQLDQPMFSNKVEKLMFSDEVRLDKSMPSNKVKQLNKQMFSNKVKRLSKELSDVHQWYNGRYCRNFFTTY